MLELPESGPLQWTVGVALVAICWALIKNAFVALAKPGAASLSTCESPSELQEGDEYPELHVPREPHCEIALDPPDGLHCSNPDVPYTFENEVCWGRYLFFHPPTVEGGKATCGDLDCAEYFRGKTRLWELRVQFHFKEALPPGMEMFFGTELEDYVPLSTAAKQVLGLAVATVRAAVGGLYHTPGDDPRRVVEGEIERPCFMLPLWAFDQYIVTPEGEKPPGLTDPTFSGMGSRRYRRAGEYSQEIDNLKANLRAGPTYTFAFWGSSRFGDVLNWKLLGIPMAGPIDLNRFIGKPPVYCVLYSLAPGAKGERRHLQSRKSYYFRAAIWSSKHRPDRRRIAALTGEQLVKADSAVVATAQSLEKAKACTKNLYRCIELLFARAAMNCCTARPRSVVSKLAQ